MRQCWTSSFCGQYSNQDRVVARRPHVLSCGGYCVVPCAIVVSQLQLDSLLSLDRERGRFVLLVAASEPARPGPKGLVDASGCSSSAMQQHCNWGEGGARWASARIINDKHLQLLWIMFLVALLPKTANEQLQEWKLKLVTDLVPMEGASPVYRFCEMTILLYMLGE